jgi:hypothetical protein
VVVVVVDVVEVVEVVELACDFTSSEGATVVGEEGATDPKPGVTAGEVVVVVGIAVTEICCDAEADAY